MMSDLQRRQFLAGAATFGAVSTTAFAQSGRTATDDQSPRPIRGDKGASIIGPSNPARESQNRDRLAPPTTDHGTIRNLRFSFTDVHNRLEPGGWARQITSREMPIATDLAIVNMRLKAGAVRELHWHNDTEWGYVVKGQMRITAIDQEGHAFQDDITEGNIWNFPAGIPHSLQGLQGDGCEFVLIFDDGDFNEDETFLLTDFLAHIPRDVLAKNFGVPETAFANIPKEQLYIFESELPGQLEGYRVAGAGPVASPYSHKLMSQRPIETRGGRVRIVDSTNFAATTTISAALVEVEPGGMRELHWHPNSDELQYHIAGESRMTVFASGATAATFDFQPGDVAYVPRNMGHYIENTGTTPLRYLEVWKSDKFADVSLRQWLAFTPFDLVRAHLKIDKSVVENIPTRKTPVVPV
jgi:oxalate decarboxylase